MWLGVLKSVPTDLVNLLGFLTKKSPYRRSLIDFGEVLFVCKIELSIHVVMHLI